MADDDGRSPVPRRPLKTHQFFSALNWKHKLRENCFKRIQEDRSRLLWKMRLPVDQSLDHKEFIKSAFQDIVSDELKKIKDSSLNDYLEDSTLAPKADDALWEYDGLYSAYEGECEEILLEMQRIFYEDLRDEHTIKESGKYIGFWEDDEDEYLARAVYEHMSLNDEQVVKEIWCPICKQGELKESCHLIYCTLCEAQLNKGDEVNLDLLRTRLAEAHAEHFDRGCRLRPKFCIETVFDLTALYIQCESCKMFEIVV